MNVFYPEMLRTKKTYSEPWETTDIDAGCHSELVATLDVYPAQQRC